MKSPHKKRQKSQVRHENLDAASLMNILERTPHPLSMDEILRYNNISRREKRAIRALLDELEAQKTVVRLGHGTRVAWTPATQTKTLQGTLDLQHGGFGFVTPKAPSDIKKDIFIPPNAINNAWHGDIVELRITRPAKSKDTRTEGAIIRTIERNTNALTVQPTRKQSPHGRIFRPTDTRYDIDLVVDTSSLETPLNDNDIIRVTNLKPFPKNDHLWQAEIAQLIGQEHSVAAQESLVKWNHHIAMEFPPAALAEAEQINAKADPEHTLLQDPDCVDLTHLPFVTIDGADARDFDDAIFVEHHNTKWELWVAIADVSRYVSYNSAIDKEAQQRCNSAYFPTSVEPMLPEALSNNLCSLMPHAIRATLVAHVHINAEGTCTQADFMPAAIRSHARLTYEQVEHALENKLDLMSPEEQANIQPHIPMLKHAMNLAKTLQAERQKRGSLELDIPEAHAIINEKGMVEDIIHRERLEAHKLIEACMLAANEAVATSLTSKKVAFPYRVHPEPDPERLESLFMRLKNTRLAQDIPQDATAKNIPTLLEQTKQAHDESTTSLLHRMILRAMMQAQYSPELAPHFGLASTCYCHFTSPIRRYADLLVHRALRHTLGFSTAPVLTGQKLLALCDTCNKQERIAIDAEREIMRRLGCLLLQGREGEIFDGVISGVVSFGFFVELGNMPVEGVVAVENLHDDYYNHDLDRQALIGTGTGRTFSLGDPVRVRLTSVNLGRLRIDLAVEGLEPVAKKPYQKKKMRTDTTPQRKHNFRELKGKRGKGKKSTAI